MNFTRQSTALILTTFMALGAVTLSARPARAQASGLFTIGDIVSATPGGSGSFDVLLTAVGGDLSVGAFTVEPTLGAGGVTFTAADFSTGTPYIFPDSFDQDNGLTLSDEADDPFPNTDLIASDSDNQSGSAVTITNGAMVGVAHITYLFDAADTPGSTYTVAFDTNGTSLSDGSGNALTYASQPGVLTVSPAASPEPSGWVTLGLTSLFTAGLVLRTRRRDPALPA